MCKVSHVNMLYMDIGWSDEKKMGCKRNCENLSIFPCK